MVTRELKWSNETERAEESVVRDLETHLGVTFPADYREFLKSHAGGRPKETDFRIRDSRRPVVGIGTFLAVVPDADYSIVQVRDWLEDLPKAILPIAEGPGGDYVCLDYRSGGVPTIVYWHHDRVGDTDEYTPVAATFAEFLELLFEPDIEGESRLF